VYGEKSFRSYFPIPNTSNAANRRGICADAFVTEDVPLTFTTCSARRTSKASFAANFTSHSPNSASDPPMEMSGRPVAVAGIKRVVQCKLATKPREWEAAFRLVAANYQERGYESPNSPPLRFTAYHALPKTVTLVAQAEYQIVATLSLVFDNCLLGLPMESIYPDEIKLLRRQGASLVEVTSLADSNLGFREFMQVFLTLMRLLTQYGLSQGADTFVISINPRHRTFYRKVLGFTPFGPWRAYPSVQNHPAEAFKLDKPTLRAHSAAMYEDFVLRELPRGALVARALPSGLLHQFAWYASAADRRRIHDVVVSIKAADLSRRWTQRAC
jgi:hypothetical protein